MNPSMKDGPAPEPAATTEPARTIASGAARQTTMGGWELEPALLAIFEERARKLALPIEQRAGLLTNRKVLVFRLGEERFAIDGQFIVEVHTAAHVTPIPGTAPWWLGLVNLRGRLYSVLDLGRWLTQIGLHTAAATASSHGELVLARAAGLTLVLFADEVQAVQQLTDAEIRPPVADNQDSDRPSVLGMTDDLIVLLDLETIFCEVKRQTQSASSPAQTGGIEPAKLRHQRNGRDNA